jgi:hypothetical protein
VVYLIEPAAGSWLPRTPRALPWRGLGLLHLCDGQRLRDKQLLEMIGKTQHLRDAHYGT